MQQCRREYLEDIRGRRVVGCFLNEEPTSVLFIETVFISFRDESNLDARANW